MKKKEIFRLRMPAGELVLGERTVIMGVLNLTPDSFSDSGFYSKPALAVPRALQLEREGADILDIGGESTRPGSKGVSAEVELRRVVPVLERLRGRLKIPISIDTRKAVVAEAALKLGAQIINDVSALRNDPEMGAVAARHGVPLILMHMRGEPATMQKKPFAGDILENVTRGLREAVARAHKAGVADSQIILDPGIGFGKNYEQNCELLVRFRELRKLGFPMMLGTSRKQFIGAILSGNAERPAPAHLRKWGTAATVTASVLGGAHIVRVHDVPEMVQVARVADAILRAI